MRKFSIDPASSIRISIADPLFADPVSEAPKKAHEHKLLGLVALGTTPGVSQFVPGILPLCPSQGQAQVFSLFLHIGSPGLSKGHAQFVSGTSW